MKTTFITIVSFFMLLAACSSQEKLMRNHDIEIIEASYKHWSNRPPVQSDVRERGTDLKLIVKNLPEELEPSYIIYRKMKSFPVEIADSSETGLTFEARIIRTSAVLEETSKRVEVSDRLVFTTADEETKYIEIKEWSRM